MEALQQEHLRHLFALRHAGKLVVSGPSLLDGESRSRCIFNPSIDEVHTHVREDPLVRAGFLVAEVYPWMGLPGDRLP